MIPDPWCTADLHEGTQWGYRRGCRCQAARDANTAAQRRKRSDPTPAREAFPFEPLAALLHGREADDGTSIWRLYHRAKARGTCCAASADKLAIGLLGIHPALVWGDAWWVQDVAA